MKNLASIPPIVPRKWLFAVSGILWSGVGLVMCLRAYFWSAAFSPARFLTFESVGLCMALGGFRYGFAKITRRNIERIIGLPEQSSIFAFTAVQGYFMIIVMISTGIVLRSSPIPKDYLSVPYNAMGGSLLIGGFNFLQVFNRTTGKKGSAKV